MTNRIPKLFRIPRQPVITLSDIVRAPNVNFIRCACALLAAIVVWLGGYCQSASGQTVSEQADVVTEPTGWAKYEVLFERNIFSNKRKPVRRDTGAGGSEGREGDGDEAQGERDRRASSPPPDPNAAFVLCGVAILDGEAMAFIEDRATGEMMLIGAGQALGSGKLKHVALDRIDFESAGETRSILIGYSMTGVLTDSTNRRSPGAQTGAAADASDGADASNPSSEASPSEAPLTGEAAIIERMRRARQQGMNSQR